MVEKVSKSLDEKYYEIDHKSGLKIYVMPKGKLHLRLCDFRH